MRRIILTILVCVLALAVVDVAFSNDDESDPATELLADIREEAPQTFRKIKDGIGETLPKVVETAGDAWNVVSGDD